MREMLSGLGALLVAVPMLIAWFWPMMVGFSLGGTFANMDADRNQIRRAISASDIAFGGDANAIYDLYRRLRSKAASPEDAAHTNRSLSVAVVHLTEERRVPQRMSLLSTANAPLRHQTRPVEIDLAHAEAGAVLVVYDRPLLLAPINAKPTHRAKVAVEGQSIFDIAPETPAGILAGFRVAAFGAHEVTDALDTDANASRMARQRFCDSMRSWVKHYRIDPSGIRIWHFWNPDRIQVVSNRLMATDGREASSEYLSDVCG